MVLTNNQIVLFFEEATQMAIPAATRLQLRNEGLEQPSDLLDFDHDSLKQITDNLRRPGGRIPDPDPNAANGATIPTPPFIFGAKSQLRIKAAGDLLRFYETVSRDITAANLQWTPCIKIFAIHWQSLKDRKKNDDVPEVPKITKTLIVTKWTESFADFLHRVIGTRTIPLSYIIRPEVDVPPAAPALAAGQPYSTIHGSVEAELIARASHTHALYRDDNAQVYYYLEEATRTTSYAASLKPFQRAKNGRGAWMAMLSQYAGEDKWRAEIKFQDDLLHNRKWKGQSHFSLDKFIAQHRNAFVSMSQCADHVNFQLPNELSRVTYLLDAIENNDAPLQAAMALCRNDNGPDGKMNDFEATASFLLPHDPVAKKRPTNSRAPANVSSTTTLPPSGMKTGTGKSGVELRFHTREEYTTLNAEQRDELRQHRNELERNGKGRQLSKKRAPAKSTSDATTGKDTKRFKKLVSEAVAKEIKTKKDDAAESVVQEDAIRSYLLSLVNGKDTTAPKPRATDVSVTLPPSPTGVEQPTVQLLQSILKRVNNH